MKHGPPTLARLVAWSVLLLGLSVGCGSGCGDPIVNPPSSREQPDPDRSTVEVDKAVGLRANGQDAATLTVTVRKADGTPLSGRTVKVSVSGEGSVVTSPETTNAQGVTTAKVASTVVETKTVTVSVDAEGGPVTLSSRPTLDFIVLPASKLAFISAPTSGTAGAELGVFDVAIQNADGETMTEATNTITVAIGSGPAGSSLKGTVTAQAVKGVARFSGLVLEKAARGYTLAASAQGLTGTTSPAFDVAPAALASLGLSQVVSPVASGSPLSLEVSAIDAFGNAVTDYTGTLHFSSDDGADTLPADYTFTAADAGRHAFTNGIVLRKAGGARKVTVADKANAALTASLSLDVVAGAPAKLVFTAQPSDTTVRTAFGVAVVLLDAAGNRTTAGSPLVSLSLDKGGALSGGASVAPVDGVASFQGLSTADDATGYVLTASGPGLVPALSNPFTVTDNLKPDQPMLFRSALTSTTATVTWTAPGDDGAFGRAARYDFSYSTNPDLSGAQTVSMAAPKASGSAESVSLTNLTPGLTYYVALKVSDNAGNFVLSTLEFTTPFSTASKLVFTTQPQNGTAGVKLAPFRVAIQDANGVTVGNESSAVTVKVNGATGAGTLTVNALNGVATFDSVRIDKAGKGYTLDASVASGSITPATSTPFDIAHAPADHLEISGPSTTVASRAISVTVKVFDAYGNAAEGYAGPVALSSNDTAAELPDAWSFTAADKGQHTFDGVVLKTSGPRTVTASASGLTPDTLNVEVTEAPPSKLVLTGLPATMKAGDSVEITVERLDGSNQRETGYTGTVRFTSTDAKAAPLGEYTFTTADQGLKKLTVQMLTVGTQTLRVEDKAAPSIFATADTSVTWNTVAKLVLDAPGSVKAGDPLRATVTALDAHDNVVKDYSGTVHFSADPADGVTVPADYAFLAEDNGSRGFDFTLEKAVATTLTVTDAARSLSASDTVDTVSPADARTLVLAAPTGPFTAGTAFTVDVTLKDAFGNVATGYRGTIGFTASTDSKAVLPGDYTFAAADNGHKSFQVTLKTAGNQPLAVKDQTSGSLSDGKSISINPDVPKLLAFRDQPQSARVRTSLGSVTVGITDEFGNLVDVATPTITLALSGGNVSAALGGVLTIAPQHGIANFPDLTVDQQGTGFQIKATGTPLSDATSAAFNITDDAAPSVAPLTVVSTTSTQVKLSWLPVGDDGAAGTATSYDLRYSTSAITAESFESLTDRVSTGAPQAPGSPDPETATVTGLSPSTTYYFALKVRDDAGNSSFSVISAETANASPCVPDCAAPSSTCGADGVSLTTTTETCVVVDNNPTCQPSQTTTTCPGPSGVCFKGACDTAAAPAADQLSISEVMHNPNTGTTQYIEVSNNTSNLLDLNGLLVEYVNGGSTTSYTVGGGGSVPVVLDHKGTFVLAQDADTANNGGVSANAAYGNAITLSSSGVIRLSHGATTVEDFTYTTAFPQTRGKAMSLSSAVMGTKAHAQSWYWCDAETQLAGGDYGTPNAPNSTCGVDATAPVDYCVIQSPKTFPSTDGNYPATVEPGSSWTIYSQFYEPSVTDRNTSGNDFYPFVSAELGYGTDSTNPAAWTWSPVFFNGGYYSTTANNNDEMMGTLTLPSAPGTYKYGFRYRFQDPATGDYSDYVYCDQSGAVTPPAGSYGSVTVVSSVPVLTNHVVISEFSGGNGSGAGTTDEFVELYNPTDSPVDLNGWTVQYKAAASTTAYSGTVTINATTAPGGTIIQPRKYFLLGGANYTGAKDASYTFDSSASTAAGGHIRIGPGLVTTNLNDPNTVDKLGYGTGNQPEGTAAPSHPAVGGSLERKAYATSTSATMGVGGVDANHGNGTDTDNNANDFVTRAVRQPQNSSSPAELP
ncbi:lamin tail domain-containing protein [Archangium violaceum]|uniref:lamin tail domain-containing protein n=1 Tax=Archangium violaceum TaxID=83451 RepID=UPI001952833D|nr:lamin tail domain-containing protein [Archangium violaceum]QRN99607.1 lamin tail domain-containing protein [Archangium violaceum]